MTLKAEYIHYDLGDQNFTANYLLANTGNGYNMRTKTDGNLARVGLNYKF